MGGSAPHRFVLYVETGGYEASLDRLEGCRVVSYQRAESRSLIRVIDESGEDYLYPSEFFVPIEVPETAALRIASVG